MLMDKRGSPIALICTFVVVLGMTVLAILHYREGARLGKSFSPLHYAGVIVGILCGAMLTWSLVEVMWGAI